MKAPRLDWHVTQCDCGDIYLEYEATSIRMSPEDFARLHRLTIVAMERFGIVEVTTEVAADRTAQRLH